LIAHFSPFQSLAKTGLLLAGLFISSALAGTAFGQVAAQASGQVTLSLDQAIAERKVEVQISGRGVSTGDSMWLLVRKKAPEAMRIEIAPGTLLLSKSGNAQRMAVQQVKFEVTNRVNYRRTAEIVLGDNQWRTYLLEAYCCDFGKPTPRSSDKYTVQLQVEPKAQAILARGARVAAGPKVIQAALWIDLNGVDGERIRRGFELTQDELSAALELLKAPAEAPEANVRLGELLEKIRAGSTAIIGKAEITADGAQLRIPFVKTVIGELRRGDQVKVIAKTRKDLIVLANIDGVERRGLIPIEQAELLEPPALGGGGVAAAVEAFTKRDTDSTTPADSNASDGSAQPRQY
jgi:hypothetical protein